MSEIKVSPEAVAAYNSLKDKHAKKWIFFEIDSSNTVVPTQFGEGRYTETREEDKKIFDGEMKAKLSQQQPLYIVYEFQYKNKERFIEKIAFIVWIPDTSSISDKVIYASGKETVKGEFTGIAAEFDFNKIGDVDYDSLADQLEGKP